MSTQIKSLDKVFTYAMTTHKNHNSNLLFSTLNGSNIFDTHTLYSIAKNKIAREVLGESFVVAPWHESELYPEILATTDVRTFIIPRLENASLDSHIAIKQTGSKYPEIFNLYNIYSECMLPQKRILGCVDCCEGDATADDCVLKRLCHTDSVTNMSPDELQEWGRAKLNIAGYSFISPAMTAERPAVDPCRRVPDHDFSNIVDRTTERKEAWVERKRIDKYKAEVCLQCAMKGPCWEWTSRGHIQWCSGSYPYTEKEMVNIILKDNNVIVPFTNAQIKYLLANSGMLAERINRKIYYTTFRTVHDGIPPRTRLAFGLIRYTSPDNSFRPFDSFREAKDVIKKYGEDLEATNYNLTQTDKAVLAALASYHYSPTYSAGWRTVKYPVLCIHRNPRNSGFKLIFYRANRHAPLEWDLDVGCLHDFYKYYQNVPYVRRHSHELSRRYGY